MKKDIHPTSYREHNVTCSCGNTFVTASTLGKDLNIEVCSNCHPFNTGVQKVATAGQVERFNKRWGIADK